MTVQIDYPVGPTGLTLTATAFLTTAGDVAGTALTFSPNTTRLGCYSATATLATGRYWLRVLSSGAYYASVWANITDAPIVTVDSALVTMDPADAFAIAMAANGNGLNPVTITVTSGAAVSGAIVRATRNGILAGSAISNGSGKAVLALANGDYTLLASGPGYASNAGAVTVNGTSTGAIALTRMAIETPEVGCATTYFVALDVNGLPAPNLTFQCRMLKITNAVFPPNGGAGVQGGLASDPGFATATSDVDGLVQFTGTLPGSEYEVSRQGSRRKQRFHVSNRPTFKAPNFIW